MKDKPIQPIQQISTGNVNIQTGIPANQVKELLVDRLKTIRDRLYNWSEKLKGEEKEEFMKYFDLI